MGVALGILAAFAFAFAFDTRALALLGVARLLVVGAALVAGVVLLDVGATPSTAASASGAGWRRSGAESTPGPA